MVDKKVTKSMRLDESLVKEIEEIGKSENRNFSNMMGWILQRFVEDWKKEQKKDEQ